MTRRTWRAFDGGSSEVAEWDAVAPIAQGKALLSLEGGRGESVANTRVLRAHVDQSLGVVIRVDAGLADCQSRLMSLRDRRERCREVGGLVSSREI